MKSHRDLAIFKESKLLAAAIQQLSLTLLKLEMHEEDRQIRRSSKSITAAIVEGYSRRRYKADFIKYLVYAQAECDKTMLHLESYLRQILSKMKKNTSVRKIMGIVK